MTKPPRQRIESQFHPLTAELAKKWYSKGYLTTAGYLVAIKNIIRPPGVELKIDNVVAFCKKWEISRSAFYRAVDALKDEFEWEATHGIIIRERSNETDVIDFPQRKSVPDAEQLHHERDNKSHDRDNQLPERDTKSRSRYSKSHNRDTSSSKPVQRNKSGTPQIYTDKTDIKTLSDLSQDERQNFEKFVREEYYKATAKKINSFTAFMSDDHFQEWFVKYQNRPEAQLDAHNEKWASHPQRDEWIEQIRIGKPRFIALGGPREEIEMRRQFVQWAEANNLVWGAES